MPELEDIEYSHEGTIGAVRGYYDFLTTMYMDPSEVVSAPPDGWPEINATNPLLQAMNKTDQVTRLLRHLPYIRNDSYHHETQAAPWCYFADWQQQLRNLGEREASSRRLLSEGADITSSVPGHVVGLTLGGNNNPIFLLDTQLGIVHWIDCPGEIKYDPPIEPVLDDPYDWAPEDEAEWRADSPAWAVADFFEVLKHQFRTLSFVPLSERVVYDVYTKYGSRNEGMIEMVQAIYREHGWPDDLEGYRKDQCLHAVNGLNPVTPVLYCPFPPQSSWCAFTASASPAVLPGYTSYASSASVWWVAHSASAVSLASNCPRGWSDAMLSKPASDIWLNNTIVFAGCYAEAGLTTDATTPGTALPTSSAATMAGLASAGSAMGSGEAASNSTAAVRLKVADMFLVAGAGIAAIACGLPMNDGKRGNKLGGQLLINLSAGQRI